MELILLIILGTAIFSSLVIILLFVQACYLVRQAEVVVIERLGKFHRILYPGIHLMIPFLDRPRYLIWSEDNEFDQERFYRSTKVTDRIDLRETVDDFPKQNVITKDNVQIEINVLLYYQIIDPRAAVYEVVNLPDAIEKLTQTTLRNVFGSLDLDESFVSRDAINQKLRIILDEASFKWGGQG